MGRVKEWALQEERVKFERAEAAYFALPEAQRQTLQGIEEILRSHTELVQQNLALKAQVAEVQSALDKATSPSSKWKERAFGLLLGVIASFVWAKLTKQWPSMG